MGAMEFSVSSSKPVRIHIHMCANSNPSSSVAPSKVIRKIYAHYIYHSLSALKHVHALFQQSFFLSLLHYWCKSITLAWHGDRGGPERGSEAALFLDEDMQQHSTNPNAKQLLQLPQATHVRKDSTYVHQKLPKLRSELVFFLCLKSSRRSIPDGEEYKFYFEAKHGRRERERREHLPPALKKSVRLWIFWCCYIWNVKNKKGAKGEMVQMKVGWKLMCFLGSPSLSLSLTWPALSEKLWMGVWS